MPIAARKARTDRKAPPARVVRSYCLPGGVCSSEAELVRLQGLLDGLPEDEAYFVEQLLRQAAQNAGVEAERPWLKRRWKQVKPIRIAALDKRTRAAAARSVWCTDAKIWAARGDCLDAVLAELKDAHGSRAPSRATLARFLRKEREAAEAAVARRPA